MSVKVRIVCEGQSENAFVRDLLTEYVGERASWNITILPSTLVTSRDRRAGRTYRGGLVNYEKAKNEILAHMATGDYVTTMFDFYALPDNFPCYKEIEGYASDIDKVRKLEKAMHEDIVNSIPGCRADRFIPYIELHEFEALFYTDLSKLKEYYVAKEELEAIDRLAHETRDMAPEDIDCGQETAPSKRLINAVRYNKGSSVVYPLKDIGIDRMRKCCPHFDEWVGKILEIN